MNIDEPSHWLHIIISLAERVAQLVVEHVVTLGTKVMACVVVYIESYS